MDEQIINIVLGLIEGAVKKLESVRDSLVVSIEDHRLKMARLEATKRRAQKLLDALRSVSDA